MKRFSEQLHSRATKVSLTASERRDLRERLVSYMEYHPLQKSVRGRAILANEPFRIIRFGFWRTARFAGVVAVVVGLGLTSLAERALPGDALYAVKIRFNEEVRGTLARTPYERIEWETERLNRRLAEVRLLESSGRLTEAVEEEIARAVRSHGESARRGIEELKTADREEAALASMKLATSLDVQSASLKDDGSVGMAAGTRGLIANALDDARRSAEGEEVELPSYERLMARTERETTRAYELLSTVRSAATEEERSDIRRRLEDIERMVAEALVLNAAEDKEAARHLLASVLQRTQRLIVFMTNIDVRANVTIDSIVPIVLTKEEREAAIKSGLAEVERNLNALGRATGSLDDTSVLEKVAFAREQATALFGQATTALTLGELSSAETALHEALSLSRDGLTLLSIEPVEVPVSNGTSNEEAVPLPPSDSAENTGTTTPDIATSTATSTTGPRMNV